MPWCQTQSEPFLMIAEGRNGSNAGGRFGWKTVINLVAGSAVCKGPRQKAKMA
jgi:hypothetical protein